MGKKLNWTPPIGPRDEEHYRKIVDELTKQAIEPGVNTEIFLLEVEDHFPDMYVDVCKRVNELKRCSDELDAHETGYTY